MVLKRKRSSSELCSSPSASSTCSSAFSFSSPPMSSATQMPIFWDNSNVSRNLFSGPSHLNSRTMKRFRDGRPSEETVHQRTLNLLFSAQQQSQQQQAAPSPPTQTHEISLTTDTNTQHSLHRFWNISSAPKPPVASVPISQAQQQSTGCEDCGASSAGDMDMDGSEAVTNSCGACGKHVCFSCSVSNLGEERRCLGCAGRRNWGTSVGWADSTMQMA